MRPSACFGRCLLIYIESTVPAVERDTVSAREIDCLGKWVKQLGGPFAEACMG